MKRIIFFGVIVGLTACSSFQNQSQRQQGSQHQHRHHRTPSADGKFVLSDEVGSILHTLKSTSEMNVYNCEKLTTPFINFATVSRPELFDFQDVSTNWRAIHRDLFQARMELRKKWQDFSGSRSIKNREAQECLAKLRTSFRVARYIEDYLLELFGGYAQELDNPAKKLNIDAFKNHPDMTLVNSYGPGLKLQSGDLIISRGNAYTSSAISRVMQVDSQFSHLAMVYVKNSKPNEMFTIDEAMKSDRVLVLETHIEIGSTIRPFKEYAADGNARNVLLRWKDPVVSAKAGQASFDFLESERARLFKADGGKQGPMSDVNYSVPYDFAMNLGNTNELFCTEIGYVGYLAQGVTVPMFLSAITKNNDLVRRLGITSDFVFAPGDGEVDPNLEFVAEFRNPHKLKGLRMKDMVITSSFDWMEKHDYKIAPTLDQSSKALLGWWLRQFDIKSVKTKFPKNMDTSIIRMMLAFDKSSEVLEQYLVKLEKEHRKQTGYLIDFERGRSALEAFRLKDLEVFKSGRRPAFHYHLRNQAVPLPVAPPGGY